MLVFMPTATDVMVADMEASLAAVVRKEEMRATRVTTIHSWWTLIPGLGGFARRVITPAAPA
jgi:hypothetical protein